MLEYLLHTEHMPVQSLHKDCEAIVDILNCFMTQDPGLQQERFANRNLPVALPSFFPYLSPKDSCYSQMVFSSIFACGIPCQMINDNLLYYAYCTLWNSQVVAAARTREDPSILLTSYGEAYKIYHHLCQKAQHNFNEVLWFGLCNNSRRK